VTLSSHVQHTTRTWTRQPSADHLGHCRVSKERRELLKATIVMTLTLLCASLSAQAQSVNPVVQWNRTLLVIVRTPGAQPATIHPTRSFALMHAAIYDAVNAIDGTHRPYVDDLPTVSELASQDAAAAAAAHVVLTALYPTFQAMLDTQLQQSLAPIPEGAEKAEGSRLGQTVAERLVALRSDDGAQEPPLPYVFGTAPGAYQSTPPNFPPQPQFTHWAHVTPVCPGTRDPVSSWPAPGLDR
jgi:hypothetical protein